MRQVVTVRVTVTLLNHKSFNETNAVFLEKAHIKLLWPI